MLLTAALLGALAILTGLLFVDEAFSPYERLTAAQQRDGDTIGAGAFEMATLSDGETCYRRYGWEQNSQAPIIVLIHGATIPSRVFAPIAAAGVKDGFRILTYDQYNRGYSDRVQIRDGMQLYTRQLFDLLNHLKLTPEHNERVVLLGLSFGGSILAHFASQHHDRIVGVVAGCPWVENLGPRLNKLKVLLDVMPWPLSPQWRAFALRYLGRPVLQMRVNQLAADPETAVGAGMDLEFAGRMMLEQFNVIGTEASLIGLLTAANMPGSGVLWDSWKQIADSNLPVEMLYAEDDEDVAVEDSERLRGMLKERSAHTNILSTRGGHGFFVKPPHLKYTFERIGIMLFGNHTSKISDVGPGAAAGL